MNSKNIFIVCLLAVVMIAVALYMGNWAVEKNPDGLKLHSPSEEITQPSSSAFGFGASIGLLGISLLYCLLAVGVLLSGKLQQLPPSKLPLSIAIVAAIGFTASYIVDGYFY